MRRGEPQAWLEWEPEVVTDTERWAAWRRALRVRGRWGRPSQVHGYLHFPHCQSSCGFCMYFHRVDRRGDTLTGHTDHLVGELERSCAELGPLQLDTAYFGGGTPSLLPAAQLERVLAAFAEAFTVRGAFTFEGNPLSLDADKLRLARRFGVDRVSMGVQSTNGAVLRAMGRDNGPLERTGALVAEARRLGLEVNVDLLLGLQRSTPEALQAELRDVLALRPTTVTVYTYQPVDHRTDPAPPVDLPARVFDLATRSRLLRAGYLATRPDRFGVRVAELAWVMRQAASPWRRPTREYVCFDTRPSHVLGLGVGAISHIHGYGWHREVTALAALADGATEPVLVGSRLGAVDELLAMWRARLSRGAFVRLPSRLEGGVRAIARARALDLVRRGLLRRRGPWLTLVDDEALDDLTPRRRRPSDWRPPPAGLTYERDLSPATRLGSGGRPSERGDPVAAAAVAARLKLDRPGARLGSARLEAHDAGALGLRIEPAPAPLLWVTVTERAEVADPRCSTRRWTLTHAPRDDHPLTPRERETFFGLVAVLRRLEG